MSVTESTASHEAALNGRLTYLDTGTGRAKLRLYDGERPLVTAEPEVGSNLISEVTLTDPAGAVAAGTLTLTADGAGDVLVTGTATWARVINGDGATAFDMSAGVTGSGADCIVSDAVLYQGGVVTIVSASFT